jgi:hypothetical protein
MLIQGTAPDTMGLGTDAGPEFQSALCGALTNPLGLCLGSQLPVGTYFRGANTTQFGGKSSIAMEGATGSENTGKAAGAAALVVSAARDAGITLRPDETREILEQTAERVTGGATGVDGNVAGLGQPDIAANPSDPPEDQWSPHFGWGRVNLGDAVSLADSGEIPPEAAIDSPDWYAPTTGNSVAIRGLARARFADGDPDDAGSFHWKLEWGVGQAPAGSDWHVVNQGNSTTPVTDFGSIDLSQVRAAIASYTPPVDPGAPTFSTTALNPMKNEFTVRLTVSGTGLPVDGVDRRVLSSADDPELRPGFPKRMGTGGEAPPRYADINGDNQQELILPTEDGTVHAYEPDGSELPGWPVHTQLLKQASGHMTAPGFAAVSAASPPREPPRGPTIADLDDDGRPEVITAAGRRIYAWQTDGSAVPGFPVQSDPTKCAPALQQPDLRHPKCGFVATPAVARLDGAGEPPSIVAPGLDGYLYVFDADGNPRPGYPLRLVDPSVAPADQMLAESINEPAIGDLNGDGKDDIVVATNETYAAAAPDFSTVTGGLGSVLTSVLANAAGGSERVYAVDGETGQYIDGWPIALNGAIQTTLPFIGPGQNPSIVKLGGQPKVVASATGSATIEVHNADGTLQRGVEQGLPGTASVADGALPFGSINLFESASLGKLTDGGGVNIVKYGLGITDAVNLLLVGQNLPYNHLIGAYDAQTGASAPAFPRVTDDFQFLSSSNIGKVQPGASNQVLAGTGLGLLHAYDGITGLDAPGFPKVTGGWLFAPAALSDDGRIADITREGYLFEWNHASLPECQSEWPGFRHDQQGSGNYDRDGTQPYKLTELKLTGSTLSFEAPGDDYGCGTVDHYEAVTSASPIGPESFAAATPLSGTPDPAAAGTVQSYDLPAAHDRYVAIRAVDEAGNVGWSASIDTNGAPPDQPGPPDGPNPPSGGKACGNKVPGTDGNDKLNGTSAGDRIRAKEGNDKVNGHAGNDCIFAQGGRDRVQGAGGDDRINAGPGNDRISGGPGDDTIKVRNGGRDRVNCGSGDDVVILSRKRDRAAKSCEKVRKK